MKNQMGDILRAALLGDALASHFNGLKHGHVQQISGGPPEGFPADPIFFPDKPGRNHPVGIHTSVGQRLLSSLARGADDLGRGPVARSGAYLLELAGPENTEEGLPYGALRQPGMPLRKAVDRWREVFPWEARDYFADEDESEGIAVAPLGLAAAELNFDAEHLVGLARLTHFHPTALSASLAVRAAADLSLEAGGGKFDAPQVMRTVLERLKHFEHWLDEEFHRDWKELGWGRPPVRLSQALDPLVSLLAEENDDLAVKTIVKTAGESHPRGAVTHVQHGFAPAGLAWALYRGLGPLPAVRAVEDVLARGGECSTIASIVAGLMAARHGAECLPDEWYETLRASGRVDQLLNGTEEDFEQWIEAERSWTAEEQAMQGELKAELDRKIKADVAKGKAPPQKKPKKKASAPGEESEDLPFAPPPHIWLKPGEEEDPRVKKKLKSARGKKKIGWKEEQRKKERDKWKE